MPRITTNAEVKNYVYNSSFDATQRGTSFVNLGNIYCADRWFRFKQGGGGTDVNTTIQSSGLQNFTNSIRFGRPSGGTSTAQTEIIQALESSDSRELAGKSVVISFYVRMGANFSGTGMNYFLEIGTGSDQGVVSAWTGSNVVTGSVNVPAGSMSTSVYRRFYTRVTLPANTNQIRFDFNYVPVGTAGANDYLEITGIMLHEGFSPVPYTKQGQTVSGELALCERYFCKSYGQNTFPGAASGVGQIEGRSNASATGAAYGWLAARFPVTMRITPTVTLYSPATGASGQLRSIDAGADVAATASGVSDSGLNVTNNAAFSGVSQRIAVQFVADAEL